MQTYLIAAGFDRARALRLYLWNAELAAAFHLPLQAVEVALRNRIGGALIAVHGARWWEAGAFTGLLRDSEYENLRWLLSRIPHADGTAAEQAWIMGRLGFGFWVALLDGTFNTTIWSRRLALDFPALPVRVDRHGLRTRLIAVKQLRNRVAHHEPVFKGGPDIAYKETLEALSWLCPHKAAWVRRHSRVPALLRERP